MFVFIFSVCFILFSSLQASNYASPSYTLSFSEDSVYLPPMMTKPSSDEVGGLAFIATVYETSEGLKDCLYTTMRFQMKEMGKAEVRTLAGPMGSNLGVKEGIATIVYQDESSLIFLYKEGEGKKDFSNVLYFYADSMGQLISTSGDQYIKAFVKVEQRVLPKLSRPSELASKG